MDSHLGPERVRAASPGLAAPPTPADLDLRESVTALLGGLAGGDRDAANALFPLLYDELRRIAHRQLQVERMGHTLSTPALVHEAYLRLVDQTRAGWVNRTQFLAVAARAMRRILVDYARRVPGRRLRGRRGAARRGRPDSAAVHWQWVAHNWAQADSELQPRVRHARARLTAVSATVPSLR